MEDRMANDSGFDPRLEATLTVLQGVGLVITSLLGAVIVVWTATVLATWPRANPPAINYTIPRTERKIEVRSESKTGAPVTSTTRTETESETNDVTAQDITNFTNLQSAIQLRHTAGFEFAVGKVLLPIFNSLLAAVIGAITIKAAPGIIKAFRKPA